MSKANHFTNAEQSIPSVTGKVVPPDMQREVRELLNQRRRQRSRWHSIADAASVAAWSYRVKFVAAFNGYASIAQAAVVVVSFLFAPLNAGLLALVLILVALAFRDAYTHRKNVAPLARYYLDSAGDAAAAGVFLLASQGLAVITVRSMALPAEVLYRGLLVCLLLIAVVRMVLRPKPQEPDPSFDGLRLSAKQIYRRMRTLNALWLMTFCGVVAHDVTDKPNHWPDFLRGVLPMITFGVWIATQADDLCRRDNLLTLFTNIKERALRQMASRLPKGMNRTDVNYSSFIALQILMFGLMALALFGAVEPFLLGEPIGYSVWHAIGGVLAFAASALSWQYVKAANRAAVQAILKEAELEKAGKQKR